MADAPDTMRKAWCVRDAERHDCEAIVALLPAVRALHQQAEPSRYRPASREQAEEDVAEGMHGGGRVQYLVATGTDGQVAGYVKIRFRRPHDPHAVRYVEIDEISVAGEQRRRGVARALLEEAARRARWSGRSVLRLSVQQANEDALAAYRALGYRTITHRTELVLPEDEG